MFWISAGLLIYLGWLAVMTDRSPRVLVPYVNERRLAGCRIVQSKRWANSRVGLTNHLQLPRCCGLLLEGGRSVHTKGMLFPIDIVVINQYGIVESVYPAVAPGKMVKIRRRRRVLELGPGVAPLWGLTAGSKLEFAHD